jgi:hypothetical protein
LWGRWWKGHVAQRGGQAFWVSIASAVRWVARFKTKGEI